MKPYVACCILHINSLTQTDNQALTFQHVNTVAFFKLLHLLVELIEVFKGFGLFNITEFSCISCHLGWTYTTEISPPHPSCN